MKQVSLKRNGRLLENKFKEYLIPTTLSGLSVMLGIVVDGIIVGNTIGPNAMAAVSVTQPLVLLFQTLFFLFGIGGATLVAISKGERKQNKANAVFSLSLFCMLLFAAIFMVLGFMFLDEFVHLICSDESLWGLTKSYARVLLLGSPFMLLVPGTVYFIRTDGFPKLSANILFLANGVNLLMDLIYIEVFGFGIAGAALATITGYAAGALMMLRYIFSKKRTLRFTTPSKIEGKLLLEICNSGLAGAVNTLLLTVKTLSLNYIVMAAGGAEGMAIFAVCNFAINLASMFCCGASDTMVPLLGMLYGERDRNGIRFVLKRTLTVLFVCLIAIILLIELFPVQILFLFNITAESTVIAGTLALRIFALSLIGLGVSFTMMYYLQTMHHRTLALTISLLRGFVLIVPSAFFLSRQFGLAGVWWAYVLSESATLLITALLCKITQLRSNKRYYSLFLFESPPKEEAVFDITLLGKANNAVETSKNLITFGKQHGLSASQANLVGLVAEEAIMYITEYNNDAEAFEIDLLCRILPQDIIVSFRDNGKPFDAVPPKESSEACFDNLSVMRRIAKKVEYVRNLGLNSTVLILERQESL